MFNKVSGKTCAVMMLVFAIAAPSIVNANINVRVAEPQGVTLAVNDIQLFAHDGSATISGQYVAFDDGVYQVQTALGVLRVAENRVRCEGAMCPRMR